MEALKEFTVPLTGLKPGAHTYTYEVDSEFFTHFENSPISDGKFEILITLDRRPDLAVLDFDIKGSYKCNCDRCLADINLPITHHNQIILKFEEGEDTDELIFVDPQLAEWNAANMIFEFISLAKPLTNVYDCKGIPCNQETLKALDQYESQNESDNSIWKDLKDIKLN